MMFLFPTNQGGSTVGNGIFIIYYLNACFADAINHRAIGKFSFSLGIVIVKFSNFMTRSVFFKFSPQYLTI